MKEPGPSGWFYRLSPHLVLRTGRHPQGDNPAEQVLRVESGAAFPLGHPTTRLCLDLLKEALAAGPANRLLDVGCGSGVLGLAAAALGVPRVVGLDISRPAARATLKNARENGLAGALTAVQGHTECLKASFELVAANLPWEVQMEKAAELDRLAASGGRLILSGFRDNQESLLLKSYLGRGWRLRQRVAQDFFHPELPADMSFGWAGWLLEK